MKLKRAHFKLLRHALHDAIGWQSGLVDAHAHMKHDPAYAEAKARVKEYRAMLKEIFGDGRTPEDRLIRANTKVVTLTDLMRDLEKKL